MALGEISPKYKTNRQTNKTKHFKRKKSILPTEKKQVVHPEDHTLKPIITKAAVVEKLHNTNDNDD